MSRSLFYRSSLPPSTQVALRRAGYETVDDLAGVSADTLSKGEKVWALHFLTQFFVLVALPRAWYRYRGLPSFDHRDASSKGNTLEPVGSLIVSHEYFEMQLPRCKQDPRRWAPTRPHIGNIRSPGQFQRISCIRFRADFCGGRRRRHIRW